MKTNFDIVQKKFNELFNEHRIELTINEMQTAGITGIKPNDVSENMAREFNEFCSGLKENEVKRLHSCLTFRIASIIDTKRRAGDEIARHYFWI